MNTNHIHLNGFHTAAVNGIWGEFGVSGQAAQPVQLASLKLGMAVYGQKLDGRSSR